MQVAASIPNTLTDLTNTVTVTHMDPDPTPGDNTATDIDPIVARPDYVITKTDGVTSAKPGDTLTYTITVTNAGTRNGTGVMVSDTFATGIFSSLNASGGGVVDLAAGTIAWNVGALAAGQSVTFTLTAKLNDTFASIVIPAGTAPGAIPDNNSIHDVASVTDDGNGGPDPTPGNNTATDDDDLVPVPDLKVTKTDGATVVQPGQILTYHIVAQNVGKQGALGVVVTDTLPAFVTFLSATSNDGALTGAAHLVNGKIVWNFTGAFAAGDTVTFTVKVQVSAQVPGGASLANLVTLKDDGHYGPDRTPGNNQATDLDKTPVPRVIVPPPPFVFAFDTFHNFSRHDIFNPVLPVVDSPDNYRPPLLPLSPVYSGEADPGATLVIDLYNPNGDRIGTQTVVVDAGGNWLANFPSSVIRDCPNQVRITQLSAPYSAGEGAGHNLRTYFAPALNPGHFFFATGGGNDPLGIRGEPLLAGLVLENSLALGSVKYGGELLSSEAMAAGE